MSYVPFVLFVSLAGCSTWDFREDDALLLARKKGGLSESRRIWNTCL